MEPYPVHLLAIHPSVYYNSRSVPVPLCLEEAGYPHCNCSCALQQVKKKKGKQENKKTRSCGSKSSIRAPFEHPLSLDAAQLNIACRRMNESTRSTGGTASSLDFGAKSTQTMEIENNKHFSGEGIQARASVSLWSSE